MRAISLITVSSDAEMVGICGSDIGLYKWDKIGQSIATLPFTPVCLPLTSLTSILIRQGHEAVGVVVQNGENVGREDIPIGTRVCVENHYYCGSCFQCTHDQPHICQAMGQFGHGMGKNKLIACQGIVQAMKTGARIVCDWLIN